MDSFEEIDGTTWVMFTWPMLVLLLLIAVGVGVIIGAVIARVTTGAPARPWWPGHHYPGPPWQ